MAADAGRLETRLGPLAVRSVGTGPALVFFAGALANGELWRDVIVTLQGRYRCITVDLPLGSHPWPLTPGADRSAPSLARLLLDCLELLDVQDATVLANDTAGGLLLLSLASDHPALARVGRLVLTNCESYEHFPPAPLRRAAALCRTLPWLARAGIQLQARSTAGRRKTIASVTAHGLDDARTESFFQPARDARIAGDLVAAMAGFHPELLLDAAAVLPTFARPVLLIWGDSCDYFPLEHAQRLAADLPDATLLTVAGAKTWVPVDSAATVAAAVADFVPIATRAEGAHQPPR